MPEQLALQEPRGDGRAVELDEGPLAARAQVVKGAGDELLARSRFAANEHRRACGSDGLDLLEDLAQGVASPDDVPEVLLGASLLLQIGILLGELVLQRLDLPKGRLNLCEGQGVIDGHGDLIGNELQEAHVRRGVGGRLLARKHQRAQPPPGGGQRKPAEALDSVRLHAFREPRPAPPARPRWR